MKNIKKLAIVALLLTGMSGKITAYTFKITNKTGTDVKVKLYWGAGSTLRNWTTIKNGVKKTISVRNLNCLNGIKVQRKEIIELDGQRIESWLTPESVKLMRPQVPTWIYPAATVVTGVGAVVAGFVEIGFQCGNQNFDLMVDEETGKIVAVK